MKPVAVLFVDDDLEFCSSLAQLLAMNGFAVTAVQDAEAGAQQALREQYALNRRCSGLEIEICFPVRASEADRTAGRTSTL
jgi:DNA-binding response OmpR family regulator